MKISVLIRIEGREEEKRWVETVLLLTRCEVGGMMRGMKRNLYRLWGG